jgi:hypothetical protein
MSYVKKLVQFSKKIYMYTFEPISVMWEHEVGF